MKYRILSALLLALALPSVAFATTIFTASMSSAHEVPANGSAATGSATITIDGDSMIVSLVWDGLVGGAPAAGHIHCCIAPGANIGVAVGFEPFPADVSGTYDHTFDLLDPAIYSGGFLAGAGGTAASARDALIAGLLSGQAYTNIHNALYPGGEIRGLLAGAGVVPEPGTLALLGLGLVALGATRARRPRVPRA